ncbi:hypothetical protein CF651_17150 [Paenibacillus rigui]|uniref:Uncharacterized protein n=1 Tax=Paenibacillus rigui TaxID=554312 RepID=A0A229UPM3_9BACL|nr:hypothetical protein CF651_17150 [Paenibacillus rigui]
MWLAVENFEILFKRVSKCVVFGQPVASGSVVNQRISDPRIPMSACYMSLKVQNAEENYYHEVWLKKEGHFAITEAWYRDASVTRKLLHDNVCFSQLQQLFGEEETASVVMRMTEIIKKSERDEWQRQMPRRA